MIIESCGPRLSLAELVLFPFDDHSLPLQTGLQLELVAHRTPCGHTRIALGPGPEGAPDSQRVVYYGSVHRVGDELWMWYLGQGDDVSAPADLEGQAARLQLNVEGLGPHASVAAEVLSEDLRPLPGYGLDDCVPLSSGLRQPVAWGERPLIRSPGGRVRLRLALAGVRPEDVRLYAAYLERA